MSDVLGQDEVDALLKAVDEGIDIEPEGPSTEATTPAFDAPQRKERGPLPKSHYDFKRPERVSKQQIGALENVHEVFARNLGASLSSYLRTIVDVELDKVEQLTYQEFQMSLTPQTCFNLLTAVPLKGNLIMEINPYIIFPIIEKLMGGGKNVVSMPDRPLTTIEWGLIRTITSRAIQELESAWHKLIDVSFDIVAEETNPQLMQVIAPNEPVVLITFEVNMQEKKGMMNLCIPYMTIEPIIERFSSAIYLESSAEPQAPAETRKTIKRNLDAAKLEVKAYLSEFELKTRQIMDLKPGDQIPLDKPLDGDIVLEVAGRPKFMTKWSPGKGKGLMQHRGHKAVTINRDIEPGEIVKY